MSEEAHENQLAVLDDGLQLSYAEHGDPEGAPVMFFHGWPSCRFQGWLLDEAGRELGLRIVSPDRPGIGKSTYLPDRKLRDWPPLASRFADYLGWDTFSVFAISGGGPYVIACAHEIPDRLEKAGIIAGAPPVRELPDKSKLALPYRLLIRANGGPNWLMKSALNVMHWTARWNSKSKMLRACERFVPKSDREAIAVPQQRERLYLTYQRAFDQGCDQVRTDGQIYLSEWGFKLADVSHPIDWWHGTKDRSLRVETARWVAAQMPNCELRCLDGDGHFSISSVKTTKILREWMVEGSLPGGPHSEKAADLEAIARL